MNYSPYPKIPLALTVLKPLLLDDARIVHLKYYFDDGHCTRLAKAVFNALTERTEVVPTEPDCVDYLTVIETYRKTSDQWDSWGVTTLEQHYQNVLTPYTRQSFEMSDFNLQFTLMESLGVLSGFNLSLMLLAMSDTEDCHVLRRETYRFLVGVLGNYVTRMRVINWYNTLVEGVYGVSSEVQYLNSAQNVGISVEQLDRVLSAAYSHLQVLDSCQAVREHIVDSPAGLSPVERRLFKLKDFKATDPVEKVLSDRLLNTELA